MRRIYFATSAMALGLAALMWATVPASGGKGHGGGGHGGGGHPAGGGGHPPAHVGSVHYAARPAPAPARPFERPSVGIGRPAAGIGAVRSEHFDGLGSRSGYRNPYRDEYFRHFRPGYRPFVFGDAQYYGYYSMPTDCPPVVMNGVTYYYCDGVYYQAYMYGGQTVYIAVPY